MRGECSTGNALHAPDDTGVTLPLPSQASCAPACEPCYVDVASVVGRMAGITKAAASEQQIAELAVLVSQVSYQFDSETGAEHPGYWGQAPKEPTHRRFVSNGSFALPVDHFASGSVVFAAANSAPLMGWREGNDATSLLLCGCGLVLCSCPQSLSEMNWRAWPCGQIVVLARWGSPCVPLDIQNAIITMTIQQWRERDPVWFASLGLANLSSVLFQAPQIWQSVTQAYLVKTLRKRNWQNLPSRSTW